MEFVHGIIVNPQETLRCSFFGYLKYTIRYLVEETFFPDINRWYVVVKLIRFLYDKNLAKLIKQFPKVTGSLPKHPVVASMAVFNLLFFLKV